MPASDGIFNRNLAAAAWLVALVGAAAGGDLERLKLTDSQIEPVQWADLDGWAADDHAAAFSAFRASCTAIARQRAREERPMLAALKAACKRVPAGTLQGERARAFFEDNFRAVRIAKLGEKSGLLTGYYEPVVEGSRFPSPEFSVPLYRRPRDMLVGGQKPAAGAFPNRASVNRLNAKQQLEPYYDRLAIEDGALDGQRLEICWIRDAFDAMSIQIQGSARVKLEDGTTLRINYDAHNGHPYTAVGRILIERNLVPREEMSMDRIRRWMHDNPDQAKELRGTNRSYVFFRITGLSNDNEPAGAQGVPLTPGRSIAVDRLHVYGTPFFIEAELPIEGARAANKFRRLMVAQDTGSAIIGPARADLYFGAGDEAGRVAGRIRQQGRFTMLIPHAFDIGHAEAVPLPLPKPTVVAV
ncbi:MAG: rane-bound lytic murein transglycosylase, partial [Alphaproteobacteria bacterium]|nr:rane-bound lytic murein transglycosylase [Alphaproteobacteria bacterium]